MCHSPRGKINEVPSGYSRMTRHAKWINGVL